MNFSGETTNTRVVASGSLFLYNAALMGGRGVISIGYPINKNGGSSLFSSRFLQWRLSLGNEQRARPRGGKIYGGPILVRNRTISVEAADDDGNVEERTGFHSCKSDNGGLTNFTVKIRGSQRIFYCSTLEIGGIEWV